MRPGRGSSQIKTGTVGGTQLPGDKQAKSGSLSVCRKKWFKNLLTHRFRYARTIIENVQFYPPIVGSGLQLNTNGTGTAT